MIHLLLDLAAYILLFPRNKYKGEEKFNKKRGVFTEEGGNLRGNLFLAWQYCTCITLLLYSSDCHLKILTIKSMKAQLCEAPWKFQHRKCLLGVPSIRYRLDRSTARYIYKAWWNWPKHKNQNLIKYTKLYFTKNFLTLYIHWYIEDYRKELFCSVKGQFKVL